MKQRGFTILELVITASVIAILASLLITQYQTAQMRSRDANRRQAVVGYSSAMEQWKAIRGSYFVESDEAGCSVSSTPNGMIGTGTGCVGYLGGGAGQMTRRAIPNYMPLSIADMLRQRGVLSKITTDQRDRTVDEISTYDFFLTLCASDGTVAQDKKEATEYAVFASLERSTDAEKVAASQHCGGVANPTTVNNYATGSRRW